MTDDDVLTAAARRVPSRREVTAAFTRAAEKARRSKSPSLSWLLSVDAKLLPLLGEVFGNPPQARREFLAQVRAHLRDIDLEMPDRAAETEYEGTLQAGRLARRAASPNADQTTKTWVTMHDSRVRPSHVRLEGMTLPLGDSFDVGGFDALHPGDWRLPPAERIDCRCRLTYNAPSLTADGGSPVDTPVAAGLAVVARDTGRVLMLQRAFDPSGEDPNAGLWEIPGGMLDSEETPLDAAMREFTEETGIPAPDDIIDSWTSDNGVYQLFIATVDNEGDLDIDAPTPDDPDGEQAEALAWWMPQDAAQNPALRPEVANTPWELLDCGCDGGAAEAAGDMTAASFSEIAEAQDDDEILITGIREDGAYVFERAADVRRLEDFLAAEPDEDEAFAAAGGADRNRGNAERLRRYWTTGPGGARIAWGSPGDWTRCVAELTEHLGVRAKGYCALRHKEMNGVWPGDRDGKLTAALEDEMTDPRVLTALAELRLKVDALTAASSERVSDAPWSPSTADYTDDQWKRATLLHLSNRDVKGDHKLPVRSPDGALNRNGVHAAAGRIHMVDAPPADIAAAARKLVALYRGPLDEEPPPGLVSMTASTAEDLLAAGSPYPGEHIYDAALFANPNLSAATPLTVDGTRVYGHVADWSVCHRSFKKCRTAPRSRSNYSQFHVGEVMTSAGPLPVGNLVLATEHASLTMTANVASQHYADSGSAVAVVRAGEDKHGIWVAGSIIEGTEPSMVAALRRCPLSGDWRAGEMVAALAVNVPGLPIAREEVRDGRQFAMVAAGALPNPLAQRLDALAAQLREERLANLYADVLAERVLQ